jgi:hypothetical protein
MFSVFLIKHHTMKVHGEVVAQLHVSLISAPEEVSG